MAANVNPIYSKQGHIESVAGNNSGLVVGPTANTATDGSGTLYKLFTAEPTNGSYIQKVRFKPIGSPAATVARVFISSNAVTSSTVTWLFDEISLPLAAASNSIAQPLYEIPMNYVLPAGHYLFVTFGTSTGAAGTGYSVVAVSGDY